jgi:CubicO group peptidase (beta-lactamase class C family)
MLVLKLADDGYFSIDDPIKKWIPAFGELRVLKPNAATLDDTEALQHDITIRHLLSHQAGLSHGVFDMGSMIFNAYHASGVRKSNTTLEQLMDQLGSLPLIYQPGQGWEYSMAPDVLARLVEIVTGQAYADALKTRLFDPLGMVDLPRSISGMQNSPTSRDSSVWTTCLGQTHFSNPCHVKPAAVVWLRRRQICCA